MKSVDLFQILLIFVLLSPPEGSKESTPPWGCLKEMDRLVCFIWGKVQAKSSIL